MQFRPFCAARPQIRTVRAQFTLDPCSGEVGGFGRTRTDIPGRRFGGGALVNPPSRAFPLAESGWLLLGVGKCLRGGQAHGALPWGMDFRRPLSGPQVFRPRRVLAAVMGLAGLLWIAVLVYLLQFERVPAKTFLSAVFFVVFFALSVAYYARTAIFVDAKGLTYRGMMRTRRLPFTDIRKVDILPGPVTVYAIRGRGMPLHFTSFFSHHRRLMQLLVERAGLAPIRP